MNTPDPINHAAPYRGPIEAVRICLRKYVDLDGRASRSEFWWFALFILLCEVCMIAMRLTWEDWRSYMPVWTPEFIVFATFVLPATSVAARRLHDTGRGDMRLLFFFLPAAMLISTIIFIEIKAFVGLHIALSLLALGQTLIVSLVALYGIPVTLAFNLAVYPIIFSLALVPIWMLATIYIPLAIFAYWWAKNDKATQSGFYFDGLPVYKKLLIMLVLTLPVVYGIGTQVLVNEIVYSFVFASPAVLIPVATFTYWWIQQGNPAPNKYDHAKTSRHTKLLVAKLPMAVVIYTAILLLLHTILVGN